VSDPGDDIADISEDDATLETEDVLDEAAARAFAKELRLPGSVGEIDASPKGPQVGAFFDVDGTLVAGLTASIHMRDRLRRRDVTPGEIVRTLLLGVGYGLGRAEFEDLMSLAAETMKGRVLDDLDEIGERLFQQKISDRLYPEMRDIVAAHVRRGHTVTLSSSASSFQVEPIARYLGIDNVLCNRFVVDNEGILTGEIVRPVLWGAGKANAVQRFASEHDVELRRSYFYADGDEDTGLMYLVGHPRPTNPGKGMATAAARRGWPVIRLTSRSAGGPGPILRMLAGMGAVVPTAVGAVAVGVATRNRRKAINVLSTWPRTLLALNNVKLNVVGEENLSAPRPAVFIFNHRTSYDAMMVASIVRRDFTGVGKKELEHAPIIGQVGKLMDVAFIDRADSKAAVAALKPIEEAARKGLSILISPEGSRLDTRTVGAFKKGAFRIAMAAGLPIVPIVLRNAESVGGRNSATLVQGTVDIAVLPPVPTEGWTVENLSERIEEVRQLYVETLEHWPD